MVDVKILRTIETDGYVYGIGRGFVDGVRQKIMVYNPDGTPVETGTCCRVEITSKGPAGYIGAVLEKKD